MLNGIELIKLDRNYADNTKKNTILNYSILDITPCDHQY